MSNLSDWWCYQCGKFACFRDSSKVIEMRHREVNKQRQLADDRFDEYWSAFRNKNKPIDFSDALDM